MKPKLANGRRVFKVALTGGPCAGRTSLRQILFERFCAKFLVIFVPEVGEISRDGGLPLESLIGSDEAVLNFLVNETRMQMSLEDYFVNSSNYAKKDVILVCDRGCADNWAWATKEQINRSLSELKLTETQVRDERYDLVIDMVTTALGAEEHYFANGQRKAENRKQAIELEFKMIECWRDHPNLIVINNESQGFQHKTEMVIQAVKNELGGFVCGFGKRFLIDFDSQVIKSWTNCILDEFDETVSIWNCFDSDVHVTLREIVNVRNGTRAFKYRRLSEGEVMGPSLENSHWMSAEEAAGFLAGRSNPQTVLKRKVFRVVWNHSDKHVHGFRLEVYQSTEPTYAVLKTTHKLVEKELKRNESLPGLKLAKDVSGYYDLCSFLPDFISQIAKSNDYQFDFEKSLTPLTTGDELGELSEREKSPFFISRKNKTNS